MMVYAHRIDETVDICADLRIYSLPLLERIVLLHDILLLRHLSRDVAHCCDL